VQAQELIRRLDVAWNKRKSGDYSEALVVFDAHRWGSCRLPA
jgi:hypothetical protein